MRWGITETASIDPGAWRYRHGAHAHERQRSRCIFIHAEEPQFNIDLLVGASMEFEKFTAHTMHADVWGLDAPVVSIDDLIAMKQNSEREKDVQDVVALLELKGL